MKETKKFFDNNRLNKGYSNIMGPKHSDLNVLRKQYNHVLPQIDMMAEYEDLNPGTFEKLLDMAEKEQNHRHSMDLLTIEKYNRAIKLGRMFSLIFVALISLTTILLAIAGSLFNAAIFSIAAFFCIALVSFFYSKNSVHRPARSFNHANNYNKFRNHKKDAFHRRK